MKIFETLQGQDSAMADKLLDYGCWCRIRNAESGGVEMQKVVAGHGDPVDAIDAACKAWHHCKTCTSIDFDSCDPKSGVNYIIGGFYPNTDRIDCRYNPGQCTVSIQHTFR